MQLRIRFRYRADTGEVEVFSVDDIDGGPRAADHDARHDRAAADVGRVIDPNPLVGQVGGAVPEPPLAEPEPSIDEHTRERNDRYRG